MKAALGLTIALGALGAGAYVMLGGRMPSIPHLSGSRDYNSPARRLAAQRRRDRRIGRKTRKYDVEFTKQSNLRGMPEQSELKLFIDNDGDLY